MKTIKILNAYAGIGGNRKLIPKEIIIKGIAYKIVVTAVEKNPEIARAYQTLFPNDKVIVTDAHQYILDHYKEFDFIWSSRPCITHSKLRLSHPNNIIYPDMGLYQEIILLQEWFKGKYYVENVEPYYPELIKPIVKMDGHFFWSNFNITKISINKSNKDVSRDNVEGLSLFKGIDLSKVKVSNKRLLLRNAVHPKLGLHIFNEAFKTKQKELG